MKTDQEARYSVVELCWALGVSRSGFYDHEQKPDCERRREDGVLRQRISLLFAAGRCTYGWRRIQKGLLREGIACGKKRIVRLMRDQELEVIQKRAFRPKTTLKSECFHDQIPLNRDHAQALLFDYIETFYNPKRLHSSLGYLSPLEFEKQFFTAKLAVTPLVTNSVDQGSKRNKWGGSP